MGAERHLGVLLSFGCFVVLLLLLFVFFFLGGAFFFGVFLFLFDDGVGWCGVGC